MLPIYSGITPEIEQFLKILQQKGSNKTLDKKKKISYGKVNFFFFSDLQLVLTVFPFFPGLADLGIPYLSHPNHIFSCQSK